MEPVFSLLDEVRIQDEGAKGSFSMLCAYLLSCTDSQGAIACVAEISDDSTMMDGGEQPEHWFNGIVRTGATLIIPNLGETSAPLDVGIYPLQSMPGASISVAQGAGANRATFLPIVNPGYELSLLASTRQCLLNGSPTSKDGFYQYSAAQDSKHPVTLREKCSARVLLTYRETKGGAAKP